MNKHCKNHESIKSVNICHSCGESFCENCLVDGATYFYCKNENCQRELQKELADAAKIDQEKRKNKLLFELKESRFPFITISFIIAIISGVLLGDFSKDLFTSLLLILLRTVVLWGLPFILSVFLFWIITSKELRSKLYLYAYFITWTALIILYLVGSYN